MSVLKETLLQKRMGESGDEHPCHTVSAEASTLLVETSDGENWLFPWQHFLMARCHAADGGERLMLGFATQQVVIVGKNLAVLVDEIARARLESVRPVPGKYQRASGADAFVTKIEVGSQFGEAQESQS